MLGEFRMTTTVLSMVIGLGVTRLLMSLVTVFRIRREADIDWMPLTWAGALLLIQLQLWWALSQLASVQQSFTFADFIFLVMLTLLLFLAAALLLPSRTEDEKAGLRVYFEQDGRYGLLALAGYIFMGIATNFLFFEMTPLAEWGVLDLPMVVLPVAAFLATARRMRAWITIAYVPLTIASLLAST